MKQSVLYVAIVIFLLKSQIVFSQNIPFLERTVNLKSDNQTFKEVFSTISAQTSVVFSYSSFNDKQRITYSCTKKPLRIALADLLKTSGCTFKQKEKFIIIFCDATAQQKSAQNILNGYIYSAEDSSKISKASVYIKQTKTATLSDQYGFFKMSYSGGASGVTVSCAKENFTDTSFLLGGSGKKEIVIFLQPKKIQKKDSVVSLVPVPKKKDSVVFFVTPKKDSTSFTIPVAKTGFWSKFKNSNFRNISDTLFSNFQFSLVPYISTNRLLSINTVNKVSLNLLVGHSKGVQYAEVGGLLNIDNGNVRYAQAGGLGNIVSGNVEGFQAAGIFNLNNKNTKGFQAGGVFNIVRGNMKGFQAGGIFNVTRGKTDGMQAAGLINYSDKVKGGQFSGLINSCKKIQGIQAGGLINVADTISGVQVSGLINVARCMKGVQVGVFNFSKECKGTPIGFFSFVLKGYHKLELAYDEKSFATIGFRSGTESFHNILFAGKNFGSAGEAVTFGYGIGTGFGLSKKWNTVFDFSSQHIMSDTFTSWKINLLNKVFAGIEFRPAKGISIAAGPTFNVLVYDSADNANVTLDKKFAPAAEFNPNAQSSSMLMWPGFKLSLKFL